MMKYSEMNRENKPVDNAEISVRDDLAKDSAAQVKGENTELMSGLVERVERTRERILALMGEIDDIKLQQNPHIMAEYQMKIGVWENKLLEAQLGARRAKRKVELVQAAHNRGEQVDESSIDRTLDGELSQWRIALEQAVASYEQAMQERLGAVAMTREETKELKSLYRTLVKRLHPDLCSGDEQRAIYFHLAQQAYERGDIEALRSLETATAGFEPAEEDFASAEEANAELALLEAQCQMLEERLQQLVASEPYVLRDVLADPLWVKGKVDALKADIDAAQAFARQCEERLQELKGTMAYGYAD